MARSISDAITLAQQHAPYLRRLLETETLTLSDPGSLESQIDNILTEPDLHLSAPDLMAHLRQNKSRIHLALALLDISGSAMQSRVTRILTRFADRCCEQALKLALAQEACGSDYLALFALGKMGAFELNYSSDIDLIAFYDGDAFDGGVRDPGEAASRAIRDAMRLLSDRTADGYVFRTDLRLRPDPSSTPLAISTRRAALYYESVGQNWERMAWIKGRPAAGDIDLGTAFLKTLEPYIWRKHLDYWAIADVQAVKSMIDTKLSPKDFKDPSPDLKLGPGGIREIEFFAQTQQIILGGRNPSLRVSGTLDALKALKDLGCLTSTVHRELSDAYDTLRQVEHRIQMINDEQVHSLPYSETKRASVAALSGYSDLDTFDAMILETRLCVHEHYNSLFSDESRKRKAARDRNLVFVGVDDDPRTLETLEDMGFSEPISLTERVRTWHRGRTLATRTVRGRELLTTLLPDMLVAMSRTGHPDEAFKRFARFFEGLRSGIQTLSMLVASPDLMDDLVTTLALAPRVGAELASRPNLLEVLLDFKGQTDAPKITSETDFEASINLVRRWHGERAFLIGHRLLHGQIAARDAASEWSDLADDTVVIMASVAERETRRRYGDAPGPWCIAGLGKFGGQDMTAGSDLDVLVIYDAEDPSEAQTWFTRFTQRLITALSAETGEGVLYEVDMRLRPSGRSGPVATSLRAFNVYHEQSAWTWEHMALTRLRIVAGDQVLGTQVLSDASNHIVNAGDRKTRTSNILDMRARLIREKLYKGDWDIKMRPGGLVDLEFIIQNGLLTEPVPIVLPLSIRNSIKLLLEAGSLTTEQAETLKKAHVFLSAFQQVQRVALGVDLETEDPHESLIDRLCRATSTRDLSELKQLLERHCSNVSELFSEKVGRLPTEL